MESTGDSIGYYTILHPKTNFSRDRKKSPDPTDPIKNPNNNALLG